MIHYSNIQSFSISIWTLNGELAPVINDNTNIVADYAITSRVTQLCLGKSQKASSTRNSHAARSSKMLTCGRQI